MELYENNNCIWISHSLWISGGWTRVQEHTKKLGLCFSHLATEGKWISCLSFMSSIKLFLTFSNSLCLVFLPVNATILHLSSFFLATFFSFCIHSVFSHAMFSHSHAFFNSSKLDNDLRKLLISFLLECKIIFSSSRGNFYIPL